MKVLVTGSAGHLGEAILRTLLNSGVEALGIDILESKFTHKTGSIIDRGFVQDCIAGADAVIHTATLHKPHIVSHSRQDFVDTNVTGTLNLLEEAAAAGLRRFVFTSTTSAFGAALVPPEGAPAAWITEDVPLPRIFTVPPKPRPRIFASCFTATTACHASFFGHRGSFRRNTTAKRFANNFPGRTPKLMSFYYAG